MDASKMDKKDIALKGTNTLLKAEGKIEKLTEELIEELAEELKKELVKLARENIKILGTDFIKWARANKSELLSSLRDGLIVACVGLIIRLYGKSKKNAASSTDNAATE